MSIIDLDTFTDPISDAIDAIGDAGDLIGGILKTVSPLLGAVPGVGTAFAVAIYAAGAVAAKDQLTDALIGTASSAMPPGVPRIAFDGAIAMAKDVAEGRTVLDSAVAACRQAAEKAGGAPATAGFDAGIAFLRGERIDQRAVDQARAFALETGGNASAASFDAGVAIAEGKSADQVVIDVARGYVNQMGGAGALTAFDTGIALGYGKTLQEAGYIGLHTLVRGNNGVEKVLNFIDQLGRARTLGEGIQDVLESDLASDFFRAVGKEIDPAIIENTLRPYLDVIRDNAGLLEVPAGELARQWAVDEAIVREAQALLRRGDGVVDDVMLGNLKNHRVPPTFDFGERNVSTNDGYARKGQAIIDGGAKWKGRLLSGIRAGTSFTITIDTFDALTNTSGRGKVTYEITDAWRRGFEIAIGACEGAATDGPGQQRIKASLAPNSKGGFDAGQEVQFNRTTPFGFVVKQSAKERVALALPKPAALKTVASVEPGMVQALGVNREPEGAVRARHKFTKRRMPNE